MLKPAVKSGHAINYSVLKQAESASTFRGFSISYVAEGTEYYTINGREYTVGAGEYLLTNPYCLGTGHIQSQSPVYGVCIDLLPEIIAEVLAARLYPDDPNPEINLERLLYQGDFFEWHSRDGNSGLGRFLAQFCTSIRINPKELPGLGPAFFYRVAEGYIGDYEQIKRRIGSIPAVKLSTRKTMLRLVQQGKDFMDAHFADAIQMADVARAATLSRYHFFRLFHAAFGVTPHQYLWQKRLRHGKYLLQSGHHSVFEVALHCGFADLASFSKAYKKQFGVSPSEVLKISTI